MGLVLAALHFYPIVAPLLSVGLLDSQEIPLA